MKSVLSTSAFQTAKQEIARTSDITPANDSGLSSTDSMDTVKCHDVFGSVLEIAVSGVRCANSRMARHVTACVICREFAWTEIAGPVDTAA
jgi:hypothetical protein